MSVEVTRLENQSVASQRYALPQSVTSHGSRRREFSPRHFHRRVYSVRIQSCLDVRWTDAHQLCSALIAVLKKSAIFFEEITETN